MLKKYDKYMRVGSNLRLAKKINLEKKVSRSVHFVRTFLLLARKIWKQESDIWSPDKYFRVLALGRNLDTFALAKLVQKADNASAGCAGNY